MAVFSDIHGNLRALKAFLEQINGKCPALTVFLGDIFRRGNKEPEFWFLYEELSFAFLFPILARCHSGCFFEYFRKMPLAGKTQISSNNRCGSVCISEEAFPLLYFFIANEGGQWNTCFLSKSAR